jgi:hypothetical protein
MKNKKNPEKGLTENSKPEKLAKYANAPYFKEKDRKAVEFLRKHPLPGNLLK